MYRLVVPRVNKDTPGMHGHSHPEVDDVIQVIQDELGSSNGMDTTGGVHLRTHCFFQTLVYSPQELHEQSNGNWSWGGSRREDGLVTGMQTWEGGSSNDLCQRWGQFLW